MAVRFFLTRIIIIIKFRLVKKIATAITFAVYLLITQQIDYHNSYSLGAYSKLLIISNSRDQKNSSNYETGQKSEIWKFPRAVCTCSLNGLSKLVLNPYKYLYFRQVPSTIIINLVILTYFFLFVLLDKKLRIKFNLNYLSFNYSLKIFFKY